MRGTKIRRGARRTNPDLPNEGMRFRISEIPAYFEPPFCGHIFTLKGVQTSLSSTQPITRSSRWVVFSAGC